jgi:hypothetical protein
MFKVFEPMHHTLRLKIHEASALLLRARSRFPSERRIPANPDNLRHIFLTACGQAQNLLMKLLRILSIAGYNLLDVGKKLDDLAPYCGCPQRSRHFSGTSP